MGDDLRAALNARLAELDPDVETELGRLLRRADSRARTRRATYALGLVAAVIATVVVLGHDWRPGTKGPEPVEDPPGQAQPLSNYGLYADPAELDPGRYRAWFLGRGPSRPRVSIEMDIPAGWGQDDIYAFATGPGEADNTRRIDLFVGVSQVSPDPCSDRLVRAGPGTHDLADALASLARTKATGPTPVTVGGYRGYQLRLEDPQKRVATEPCSGGSALREAGVDAGLAMARDFPGWTSLVWVLDVGGVRAVINASHGPAVTPAQEAELVIVESASFVLP